MRRRPRRRSSGSASAGLVLFLLFVVGSCFGNIESSFRRTTTEDISTLAREQPVSLRLLPTFTPTPLADTQSKQIVIAETLQQQQADPTPVSTLEIKWASPNVDKLNVRIGPGTEYVVVSSLNIGACVIWQDVEGDWTQLTSDGEQERWVATQYLDLDVDCVDAHVEKDSVDLPLATPVITPLTGYGVVSSENLNVRMGPGTEYEVVDSVTSGECKDILGEVDGWYLIRLSGERFGWCSAAYMDRVTQCSVPEQFVVHAVATSTPSLLPSYLGWSMTINGVTVSDGYIHECFGSGDSELRWVGTGTPIEVLGVGDFQPPSQQSGAMGSGPFVKIRLWDGQYAWMAASAASVDVETQPVVSGRCEEYDIINWARVRPATATPLPTATTRYSPPPAPQWSPPVHNSGCCKICSAGKACGDSCISRSYTCRKGPGCACNG